MQKEAEQRVREMQSRARLLGEGENFSPPRVKQDFRSANPPKKPAENPLSSLLGGMENDKLVILALLWILWNEHADSKLILALLYLLL
ncbi:MAG: hypothetical protein IKL57_08245 [Oscillospiraceae bacterium]|nr:hypothetical protein [Oscillospiraceae bacterium]